jgi:hypothetical protein
VEDFTTRQQSHFQADKMKKSCSPESMFFSSKFLLTLEEFHFQATKMPNRDFMDARYRWVDSLMTIEKSHFMSPNRYRGFKISRVPLSSGSHDPPGIVFSGRQNEEKLLTGINVFFIQVSLDP